MLYVHAICNGIERIEIIGTYLVVSTIDFRFLEYIKVYSTINTSTYLLQP